MYPPKAITSHVLSFCESIVANVEPKFVDVRPGKGAQPDNCIFNVRTRITNNGGNEQIGWAIFEWPNVLIESIFHSVWVSPREKLVDITPKHVPVSRILFLPDLSQVYEGHQIDGIRRPLSDDSDIKRFCELVTLMTKEMNAGDLKYEHGEIQASPTFLQYAKEKSHLRQILSQRYGAQF